MGIGSFPASQVRLVLDEQRLDCCATKQMGFSMFMQLWPCISYKYL